MLWCSHICVYSNWGSKLVKISTVLKQRGSVNCFPLYLFVILPTFFLCDGEAGWGLQNGEGGFSLESVQTHIYLDCLTFWGQSSLIDFAGTKRVLIFKDFNLLFCLLVTRGGGGRFRGLLTVTMLHNKKNYTSIKDIHTKQKNHEF